MTAVLADLIAHSAEAIESSVIPQAKVAPGGVDPLGLRQINFQLMDTVLPDLNNVATRVRPFVVLAWAWRQARRLVQQSGKSGEMRGQMLDFVDRTEAIYAWSQFLLSPAADLPGGQALRPLLTALEYQFGGPAWIKLRDTRRMSTGLISPLNYGPTLKSLGWVELTEFAGVLKEAPQVDETLDSFEACFAAELAHPAFSQFGDVTVSIDDARRWGLLWAIEGVTGVERAAALERVAGPLANRKRQLGMALIRSAWASLPNTELNVTSLRARMAEKTPGWTDTPDLDATVEKWRRIQVRQVFRLALEGLLHWIIGFLAQRGGIPASSVALADAFLAGVSGSDTTPAAAWLSGDGQDDNPILFITMLNTALASKSYAAMPEAITSALMFCVREAPDKPEDFEAPDRLPLAVAAKQFRGWSEGSRRHCLINVIEKWVMAQHAYWSVNRGLGDARQGGKMLLRLRVVMDDGGWALTPGTRPAAAPLPTADRLAAAVSLLRECKAISDTPPELPVLSQVSASI